MCGPSREPITTSLQHKWRSVSEHNTCPSITLLLVFQTPQQHPPGLLSATLHSEERASLLWPCSTHMIYSVLQPDSSGRAKIGVFLVKCKKRKWINQHHNAKSQLQSGVRWLFPVLIWRQVQHLSQLWTGLATWHGAVLCGNTKTM